MKMGSLEEFKKLSVSEQIREGEDSLLAHILEKGIEARSQHSDLSMENLDAFLGDENCLRYPTRFVYEFGADMSAHQMAQPEEDFRSSVPGAKVVYLRPVLRKRPDLALAAFLYMIPLINYGEIVRDEHCLVYAASVLGLSEDECYALLCEAAEYSGSEEKYQSETSQNDPAAMPVSSCGGSCGGCCS